MSRISSRVIGWWVVALIAALAALLIAWLARLVTVPVATLLTAGAVVIGLSWLIVLVTVPWNLYFAARRASAAMAVSRVRGISVLPADDAEAAQLARRMLLFALGAHAATAMAAAFVGYALGHSAGYYLAGVFVLATAFRPAAAYFTHVRERIRMLTRESTHPRDDVATLREGAETITSAVDELRLDLQHVRHDLRRTESGLADSIAHARQLFTADLTRLQAAQAADREAARSRYEELGRRIDEMVRRIEATLDGVSDHQELLTGIRALVRMVRTDPG